MIGKTNSSGVPLYHAHRHAANGADPITPESIGVKGIAYNLLDNSYFRNPVNQRGAGGTYAAWGGYTLDRWKIAEKATTLSVSDSGLNLNGAILQIVANYEKLAGKILTVAIKIGNEIFCCSGTVTYTGVWHRIAFYVGDDFTFEINAQTSNVLWVQINTNTEKVVEWVALYEGEYTAETLPKYMPKGYGVELAECLQYFRVYATDSARPKKGMDCSPPMRINNVTQGTLTIDGATCYFNSADL